MKTDELEQTLRLFYQISGMGIAILSHGYHCVYENPDGFCLTVGKHKPCLDACIRSDNEAYAAVRATKKPYLFNCPHGIREIVVPILRGKDVIAYLIAELGVKAGEEASAVEKARAISGIPDLFPDPSAVLFPLYTPKAEEAVLEMLTALAKRIEDEDLLAGAEQSFAEGIRHYLLSHFTDKLTLGEISRHLHCSTVTVTQTFRRAYGTTVMRYVTDLRMNRAEELLAGSARPIGEIAASCGFSDFEYFSRCFKARHGVSPSEWRRQNRKAETL